MATSAVQSPNPSQANGGETKSRRKKAKEGGANGSAVSPAAPDTPTQESYSPDVKGDDDGVTEHPYIKELAKQIRNNHKKLAGMQKTDAVIAENPGVSLDDLVAQRKINTDQKAAALKKPQIQQHLAALEEQISQYRKFASEYHAVIQKQKEDLTSQHEKELEKVKDEVRVAGVTSGAAELQKQLLVFSQFLRAAAARRALEEAKQDNDECRAFEGALLWVYGGDEHAVETAIKLIEGVDEQVPGVDGVLLPIKYSDVKQASIDHDPNPTEDFSADAVPHADATASGAEPVSDPTIAHAGLTELDDTRGLNGTAQADIEDNTETARSPQQTESATMTGNAAGDRWDVTSAGAEKPLMEEDYKMVPRPQDELETPASAASATIPQEMGLSWADDQPPVYESATSGNLAGESWDSKAAGDQTDSTWAGTNGAAQPSGEGWGDGAADSAAVAVPEEGDGFHQVPGRHRGRGGRGRGGDGEFRGRGRGRGGFRVDGEFRPRGRGGFRGGRGEQGEFRGRGGGYRGRGGPRGGAGAQTPSS